MTLGSSGTDIAISPPNCGALAAFETSTLMDESANLMVSPAPSLAGLFTSIITPVGGRESIDTQPNLSITKKPESFNKSSSCAPKLKRLNIEVKKRARD